MKSERNSLSALKRSNGGAPFSSTAGTASGGGLHDAPRPRHRDAATGEMREADNGRGKVATEFLDIDVVQESDERCDDNDD